jgi:hypothetical protein
MVSTFEFIRIVNSQNLLPNDDRPCIPPTYSHQHIESLELVR